MSKVVETRLLLKFCGISSLSAQLSELTSIASLHIVIAFSYRITVGAVSEFTTGSDGSTEADCRNVLPDDETAAAAVTFSHPTSSGLTR